MADTSFCPDRNVYRLRVVIAGISPLIWRAMLEVAAGTTVAGLHIIVQTMFGWSGETLHRFVIGGTGHGISYLGPGFRDGRPGSPGLRLREGERFVLTSTTSTPPGDAARGADRRAQRRVYPLCAGGRRAGRGLEWAVERAQPHLVLVLRVRAPAGDHRPAVDAGEITDGRRRRLSRGTGRSVPPLGLELFRPPAVLQVLRGLAVACRPSLRGAGMKFTVQVIGATDDDTQASPVVREDSPPTPRRPGSGHPRPAARGGEGSAGGGAGHRGRTAGQRRDHQAGGLPGLRLGAPDKHTRALRAQLVRRAAAGESPLVALRLPRHLVPSSRWPGCCPEPPPRVATPAGPLRLPGSPIPPRCSVNCRLGGAVMRQDPGRGPAPWKDQLGEERPSFLFDICQRDREDSRLWSGWMVAMSTPASSGPGTDGWFEAIAGRPTPAAAVLGYVQTFAAQRRALFEVLKAQGMQATSRSPSSPTAAKTSATCRSISRPGRATAWMVPPDDADDRWRTWPSSWPTAAAGPWNSGRARLWPTAGNEIGTQLQRLKWFCWHGNVFRALQAIDDPFDLDITEPCPETARLLKALPVSSTSAPTPGGSPTTGNASVLARPSPPHRIRGQPGHQQAHGQKQQNAAAPARRCTCRLLRTRVQRPARRRLSPRYPASAGHGPWRSRRSLPTLLSASGGARHFKFHEDRDDLRRPARRARRGWRYCVSRSDFRCPVEAPACAWIACRGPLPSCGGSPSRSHWRSLPPGYADLSGATAT